MIGQQLETLEILNLVILQSYYSIHSIMEIIKEILFSYIAFLIQFYLILYIKELRMGNK